VHPYGTSELAYDVLRALKKSDYVIIRGHGSIAIGKTLGESKKLIFDAHEKAIALK
jgi:ribulose-5-phosphate 4-epimerase/fuculose-1-phosphate aldolase